MPMSDMEIHKASQQVANTYELLEAVLLHLPYKDLVRAQAVSKSFSAIITRSSELQRRIRWARQLSRAIQKLHRVRVEHPWHATKKAEAWEAIEIMMHVRRDPTITEFRLNVPGRFAMRMAKCDEIEATDGKASPLYRVDGTTVVRI